MGIFKELRRRKVIRVAVVYVVTAWLLIQVAGEVADPLSLPDFSRVSPFLDGWILSLRGRKPQPL